MNAGALRRRDYRLVLGAMSCSTIGDWLYAVALVVVVVDATGSAAWVAGAGIARLLPYVLFSSLAGVVADRVDRRTVMITADVARAVVMALLAAVTAAGGPPVVVIALAFVSTAAGTPFGPAQGALLPALVPEDELAGANSVNSTVEHTSLLLGPALGGLLLAVVAPPALFGINAVTFVVSALLVAGVRTRDRGEGADGGSAAGDGESPFAQLAEGIGALRGTPEIAVLVLLAVAGSFQYGVETVVWVLLAEQRLGTGAEGVGFLLAAMGAGGLVMAAAAPGLASRPRPERVLVGVALASGLPLVALAVITSPWLAYAAVAFEGAGGIVLDVLLITLLQQLVRERLRGRVLGLYDTATVAAILAGMALTPVVVEVAGLTAAVLVGGVAVPLVALVGLPVLARAGRDADRRRAELAPRVARLAGLPILDGAGTTAVEALAASLRDVAVPAGTTVVREGDPADAVYVVVTGMFDVSLGGPVSELGPGDHFGEIGVLRRTARTATVTARTDATLLRLDGAAFLDAIERSPAVPRALRDGLRERLARTHPAAVAP